MPPTTSVSETDRARGDDDRERRTIEDLDLDLGSVGSCIPCLPAEGHDVELMRADRSLPDVHVDGDRVRVLVEHPAPWDHDLAALDVVVDLDLRDAGEDAGRPRGGNNHSEGPSCGSPRDGPAGRCTHTAIGPLGSRSRSSALYRSSEPTAWSSGRSTTTLALRSSDADESRTTLSTLKGGESRTTLSTLKGGEQQQTRAEIEIVTGMTE